MRLGKFLLVPKHKKFLKTLFKVSFIIVAFYVVFSKVSIVDIWQVVVHADITSLFIAFIFFNVSKVFSSVRLNQYFHFLDIFLSQLSALKLYYIGMFYNLFLPGGIGGDGYKVYLLKRYYPQVEVKSLLAVTLLDRVSGLIPLLFLGALFYTLSNFGGRWILIDILAILTIIAAFPLLYLGTRLFFKRYLPLFLSSTLLGTIVQIFQVLSALFIVLAISEGDYMLEYLTLFLISSVVAVLPLSIGGVGIREITFLYGLQLIALEVEGGVTFALIFFMITALSSLLGVFFSANTKQSQTV